jgi:DNA-binding NarL/FixJ family response regulator
VPRDQLVHAVRVVARGESLLAPRLTRRLVERFVAQAPPSTGIPEVLLDLSPRERDVLALVARGLTNGEIAGQLVVGEATVKTHVGRILAKLGLRDRVQAVVLAYEAGFVQPGSRDVSAPASRSPRGSAS